ncbi:MAG: VOC family protein [Patescibacteria group bacterium]
MEKNNSIGWFDIYVTNLDRAVKFYETVLDQKLEAIPDPTNESKMMGFVTNMEAYGSGGALVESKHTKPGVGGTMIYFNSNDSLVEESRVEGAGGKVIRSKFSIGNFGWVSICQDTEGNLFGINSTK